MSLDTHKLFVALHEARQLPSASPEDVEALVSAAYAIHFIELSGHEYNFEDYLAGFNWPKNHPRPSQTTPLLMGGAHYCVAYSLDSGLPTLLRLPTAEALARLDEPTAQGRFGRILLTLHKARECLVSFPQHVEALTSAEVALHYIQESGLSDSFAEYLADTSSVPISPVRSFATRDEADTWLKNHPRPPHGGWVLIGQDRYSVGYWRESGRRVLLRVPTEEELKRVDDMKGEEEA